jgi:hypothetical protein
MIRRVVVVVEMKAFVQSFRPQPRVSPRRVHDLSNRTASPATLLVMTSSQPVAAILLLICVVLEVQQPIDPTVLSTVAGICLYPSSAIWGCHQRGIQLFRALF